MQLSIHLAKDEFTPLLKQLGEGREMKNALRRVIDPAARDGRREAIKSMVADIGVPLSKFRFAVPTVRASKQYNLTAIWDIGPAKIGILNAAGSSVSKAVGLLAKTFRTSGGASANLRGPHSFLVTKGGATFVATRTSSAAFPIKSIYTESPNTAMRQPTAAPRLVWEKVVNASVAIRLGSEIQRALDGAKGGPSTAGQD